MTAFRPLARLAAVALVGLAAAFPAEAQRRFEIHSRGMLHETVFNTGEIGRAYHQGGGGNATEVPMMEWPGNSAVTVDDINYDGKHYTNGGGVYISAQLPDSTERVHALSGGVGASQPDVTVGRWSYPLTITRTENYPVLADGTLNGAYDPNEAEEIIVASWATPVGITVTRTSRAWSYPDYDDLIVYEYAFEYTGDRDGDTVPDTDQPITDVTIAFAYGLAPNMFGNLRTYGSWSDDEYQDNDQRGRFDPLRFLNYTYHQTGLPDPVYYDEWGRTGQNGGGLNAPGTPGYMMLHFDTERLALQGQTLADVTQSDSSIVWTQAYGGGVKIKQPWFVRQETSNLRQSKLENYLRVDTRKNAPLREGSVIPPEGGVDDPAYQHYLDYWVGAGRYNFRQTRWATGRITVFGPYRFEVGETARFALAEVIGFGAVRPEQAYLPPGERTTPEQDDYLVDWGGSCGEDCGEDGSRGFFPIASYADTVRYGGNPVFPSIFPYGPGADEGTVIKRHGSPYLSEYDLPDYVNSDVVTIREVADKAYHAYTGRTFTAPEYNRPELNPEAGVYRIPIPVPAPALTVASDERAQNVLSWSDAVERFSAPRLQGAFDHYRVARSTHPAGPWETIAEVNPGDPAFVHTGTYSFVPDGDYVVLDPEPTVGETFYYSVVSVDENGRTSGRTNVTAFETQLGAVAALGAVHVVPNPFVVNSGFGGASDSSLRLGFYGLPARATIRIYSFAGQLVETIEHDSPTYSVAYLQETRNNQRLASGVYFYVVTTPDGEATQGKFVIIR
ncbi:T9SS type A sorting domain-containing protein [Rubrivirga sp. IMCC45206]|uniref:T9SS type A sorting domain-containing protein n=1 Tax=Rubrivirga sp. IMCC45206 TaxID=3391614 RepID=UPI00398FE415